MARHARGELHIQKGDERGEKNRGGFRRTENGDLIFFRRFHHIGPDRKVPSEDDHRGPAGKERIDGFGPLFRGKAFHEAVFAFAADLDAVVIEVIEIAVELQAGAVDLHAGNVNIVRVARGINGLEGKLLDDARERNGKGSRHLLHLPLFSTLF